MGGGRIGDHSSSRYPAAVDYGPNFAYKKHGFRRDTGRACAATGCGVDCVIGVGRLPSRLTDQGGCVWLCCGRCEGQEVLCGHRGLPGSTSACSAKRPRAGASSTPSSAYMATPSVMTATTTINSGHDLP
eukprot:COSAG01_NODE_35265_length_534_cov_2.935632_1_plen_129_part_10